MAPHATTQAGAPGQARAARTAPFRHLNLVFSRDDDSGGGLTQAQIGGIIGGIVGFVVLLLLVWFCCTNSADYRYQRERERRRRRRRYYETNVNVVEEISDSESVISGSTNFTESTYTSGGRRHLRHNNPHNAQNAEDIAAMMAARAAQQQQQQAAAAGPARLVRTGYVLNNPPVRVPPTAVNVPFTTRRVG